MRILAALPMEQFAFRQAEGGSTRIDLSGVHFSVPVKEFPTTLEPHLMILVYCPADQPGTAMLEVTFTRHGEEVARIRQPFAVEPGKFGYRLVKGEIGFEGPDTVEAHCLIEGTEQAVVVPISAIQA